MYKVVEDYINSLNSLNRLINDANGRPLEGGDKEIYVKIRDSALNLLNNIFAESEWSEEFVTSFAVYCNFFIVNGFHKKLDNDFAVTSIYEKNNMDEYDKKYLEYIRKGIFEQNQECFLKAIDIYKFDIPKLYVYILSFLEICAKDMKDFETNEGKEEILVLLELMDKYKTDILGELKELAEPLEISAEEAVNRMNENAELLPRIVITNLSKKVLEFQMTTLDTLSSICGKKIKSFNDICDGMNFFRKCLDDSENMEKAIERKIYQDVVKGTSKLYGFASDELINSIVKYEESDSRECYFGKDVDDREDNYLVCNFLNLPEEVSETQYRNIALARQIKLNKEKEQLIKKNEKMVEDYSHSVENIMKPALIAEIANCLRGDEKNRELYNKIMYVYFNEIITQNECRLLKMVHNMSVSKGAIRENISKARIKNTENAISLQELVYKAINQISLQLTENSQKSRYMFILKKMAEVEVDSNLIDRKLWNLSKEKDAIYMLYKQNFNFEVNISTDLKELSLNEEEVGTSFLYTRIVEVISNALTYGDYGMNKTFQLNIYKERLGVDYIVIEMVNKIGDRSFSNNREGNGLSATKVMLERINSVNSKKESFVDCSERENGYFVTKMYIDADLYI